MPTTILLFISILGLLVLLHEGGHFIAAKRSGIRVHEFGFGFPPRLFARKYGETEYSFNLLPFGGFVRIEGEDGASENHDSKRSFATKPLSTKLKILFAGVVVNWLLAVLLFGLLQTLGAPVAVADSDFVEGASITIAGVTQDSPAQQANIGTGDVIVALSADEAALTPATIREVQEFLKLYAGKEVTLTLQRGDATRSVTAIPRVDPPEGQGALGVSLLRVATLSYPWYEALWRGVFTTVMLTISLASGIFEIFRALFSEARVAEGLAGPVGIAVLTGEVRTLGALFVLNFIAILSLNLALLNAIPFPALDGGRAAIAFIERLARRPIPVRVLAWINGSGFMILILGIAALTVRDIKQLL